MTVKEAVELCSLNAVIVSLLNKDSGAPDMALRIIAKEQNWFDRKEELDAVDKLPELAAAEHIAFVPYECNGRYGPAVYMVAEAPAAALAVIRAALEAGRFTGEYETEAGMVYTGWAAEWNGGTNSERN